MYFDRFDICEAYFLALSHCHGGQWSREYARLCKLMSYFKPSPMLSIETLSDNGREIYDSACDRFLRGKPWLFKPTMWVWSPLTIMGPCGWLTVCIMAWSIATHYRGPDQPVWCCVIIFGPWSIPCKSLLKMPRFRPGFFWQCFEVSTNIPIMGLLSHYFLAHGVT